MTDQLTRTDLDLDTATPPPPLVTTPAPSPTPSKQPRHDAGRRRALLVVAGAVAVAGAVTGVLAIGNLGGDPDAPTEPATERRPAYLIIQNEIDEALAEIEDAPARNVLPTAQIVQDEIDAALAELQTERTATAERPAYLIIQDEIDAALRELRSGDD